MGPYTLIRLTRDKNGLFYSSQLSLLVLINLLKFILFWCFQSIIKGFHHFGPLMRHWLIVKGAVAKTTNVTTRKKRMRQLLRCNKSFMVIPSTERSPTRPHVMEFALPPDHASLATNPLTCRHWGIFSIQTYNTDFSVTSQNSCCISVFICLLFWEVLNSPCFSDLI